MIKDCCAGIVQIAEVIGASIVQANHLVRPMIRVNGLDVSNAVQLLRQNNCNTVFRNNTFICSNNQEGKMSSYDSCPQCGHKPSGFTVAYMPIHRCNECKTEFCHECKGSNNGRKCPECGSERISEIGRVYVK
jgi:hypothetical protein